MCTDNGGEEGAHPGGMPVPYRPCHGGANPYTHAIHMEPGTCSSTVRSKLAIKGGERGEEAWHTGEEREIKRPAAVAACVCAWCVCNSCAAQVGDASSAAEGERERERRRVCVCVCLYVSVRLCVSCLCSRSQGGSAI